MFRLALLCSLWLTSMGIAADWPQWLGPTRDAVSDEKVAPWKAAPTIVWRKPVGEGHSSPIVADGKVFLHVKADGKDAETVIAFDRKTGDIIWEKTYERGPFQTPFGNGPRATPSYADGRLFTLGGTGMLTAWDAKTGKQLWQVDTLKAFAAKNLTFGVSASPLVVDGKVIVQVGGKGTSIVAFEAASGEVLWQERNDPASYAAPVVRTFGGTRELIVLTGSHLCGMNIETGATNWEVPFKDLLNESSTTPIMINQTLIASSVTAGSIGLDRRMVEGKTAAVQIWKNPQLTCYFGTPVPYGKNQTLMVTGTLAITPSATLRCVDASTGKEVWSKPKVGKYHATLMRLADGNVLMMEEGGELVLIGGGSSQYKELARSKLCGETWAHPALVDGQLIIRDAKELMVFKLGQ